MNVVQGPPYPAPSGTALLSELQQRYCSWDLAGSLGPVGHRGERGRREWCVCEGYTRVGVDVIPDSCLPQGRRGWVQAADV